MGNAKMYRRGFLCVPTGLEGVNVQGLEGWRRIVLRRWAFYLHPETPFYLADGGGSRIALVLGEAFVGHGGDSLDESLERLRKDDLRPLESLSGRFAIFMISKDDLSVLHDPLGSQTVFYCAQKSTVASHAALVADALSIAHSSEVRRFMKMPEQTVKSTRFLPGDWSLYDGVRLLLPNNELMVRGGRTRRYWPDSPIGASTPDEAFRVWDEYFTNYAEHLRPRSRVVAGLTGGVDSRSIIATLRSKSVSFRYETWDVLAEVERARIPAMVEHLGGQHRWIDRKEWSSSSEFLETVDAAAAAAGFTRGRPSLPAQVERHASSDDVFIYGHGSGVMRGSYSRKGKP